MTEIEEIKTHCKFDSQDSEELFQIKIVRFANKQFIVGMFFGMFLSACISVIIYYVIKIIYIS